jgi:ribosomal protein S18 acetylase RimI-like enzyme
MCSKLRIAEVPPPSLVCKRYPRAVIRPATRDDLPTLVAFIHELAEFENLSDQVELDEQLLGAALFGPEPSAFARLAMAGDEAVGMVIYSRTYSTWTGRPGIYVVDLYVKPDHRGQGIGSALLGMLARLAVDEGLARVEWAVLDWNEPALDFYRSLGAVALDDWITYRLTGPALHALAEASS